MKTITLISFVLSFFLDACFAQSTNKSIKIKLSEFSKIEAGYNLKIVVIPQLDSNFIMYANAGAVNYQIKKNKLRIKVKNNFLMNDIVTVIVGVKNVDEITLNDNAELVTQNELLQNQLKINANDYSSCLINTTATQVNLIKMPKSKVVLNGNYKISETDVNGYGDMILTYTKYEAEDVAKK